MRTLFDDARLEYEFASRDDAKVSLVLKKLSKNIAINHLAGISAILFTHECPSNFVCQVQKMNLGDGRVCKLGCCVALLSHTSVFVQRIL